MSQLAPAHESYISSPTTGLNFGDIFHKIGNIFLFNDKSEDRSILEDN